jgi:hypothetical protein
LCTTQQNNLLTQQEKTVLLYRDFLLCYITEWFFCVSITEKTVVRNTVENLLTQQKTVMLYTTEYSVVHHNTTEQSVNTTEKTFLLYTDLLLCCTTKWFCSIVTIFIAEVWITWEMYEDAHFNIRNSNIHFETYTTEWFCCNLLC